MFNIIFLVVMFFLLSSICMHCEEDVYGGYFRGGRRSTNNAHSNTSSKGSRSSREHFNESDSIYDRYGNEHLLDDYGNCYECDDQHDF